MPRPITILALAAAGVAACTPYVQTSSGQAYLDRYPDAATFEPRDDVDEKVRELAAVEPILDFPARIGLARIAGGRMTPLPMTEVEAWTELAARLGPDYGEFVPISPLVAEMVHAGPNDRWPPDVHDTVTKIRLGAARQHVDAVLIYETLSTVDSDSNPLAFADITLIGGFILPSRSIDAVGYANALLVDVRNGYPYATASTALDRSAISTSWGVDDRSRDLAREAETQAVLALVPEVEDMVERLRLELAERRLAAAAQPNSANGSPASAPEKPR